MWQEAGEYSLIRIFLSILSLNIINTIKSGRLRWKQFIRSMVAVRNAYNILCGEPE
jgi:hypothetical protein